MQTIPKTIVHVQTLVYLFLFLSLFLFVFHSYKLSFIFSST